MSGYDWKVVRIKDIGKVITGRTPPTAIKSYFGNNYPFITPADMKGDKFIVKPERGLSSQGANFLANNSLPPRSIAVSCIGWQMGKVAMISSTSFTNQQINTIIPCNSTNPDFIYYSLCTRQQELRNLGSVGTRTPILIKSTFENFQIQLPPLSTQQKIAAILSSYDDLIENNTRHIAILEEIVQSLYQEWFVRFQFPGREKNRMVASALGMIPEGWELVNLSNIAHEIRRGVNPNSIDPETPYLGLEHLPRKSIALSEWGIAGEVQSTKLIFKKGEILFGKIRPYFHKVGVAPLDGVCSSDTIVILPKSDRYYALVLCCVSSDDFVNYATKTSQGTKMPRASWDVLVKYALVMPPAPILSQFDELVREFVLNIQTLIFRNRTLRRTRDLLLPKLISGEIDVEQLKIYSNGGTYESSREPAATIS
jgi:type I restriction enzyme, S subunit